MQRFSLVFFLFWFWGVNAQMDWHPSDATETNTVFAQAIDNQLDSTVKRWETISPRQILRDIKFVKRKLSKKHYNINWEGRQKEIFAQLDDIAEINERVSLDSFLVRLDAVISTIDDGHTRIESTLLAPHTASFKCELVDKETILLRIPDFMHHWQLSITLDEFAQLKENPDVNRIVVDIRGNQGGAIKLVGELLQKTLTEDFYLYRQANLLPKTGLTYMSDVLVKRLQKFRRQGDYFVKKGRLIQAKNKKSFKYKYLLVDSTIISGAMLAAYHYKKDGYMVLGSEPHSLFNTFGNITRVILPKSEFYLYIATMRLIVDENNKFRNRDMLHCDYPLINNELRIGLYESESKSAPVLKN